ncbi:MAG: 3-isopropylmalate dehydratase [Burkholderiaceae bacterium]
MTEIALADARVWRLPDDVDTDALAPGRYMSQGIEAIAAHCLSAIRPEFAAQVRAGDIVVAGERFGIGSSREQAAEALRHLGVAAVLAPSFAGLFYRNAINLGLPVLVCAQAAGVPDGALVRWHLREARLDLLASGESIHCETLPAFLLDIIEQGGLLPTLRARIARGEIPTGHTDAD